MSLADGGHLTKRQMRRKLTETKKVVRELEVVDILQVVGDASFDTLSVDADTTLGSDSMKILRVSQLLKIQNAYYTEPRR